MRIKILKMNRCRATGSPIATNLASNAPLKLHGVLVIDERQRAQDLKPLVIIGQHRQILVRKPEFQLSKCIH